MPMVIKWHNTSIQTRTLTTSCGRFRPGDFLLFYGQLCRVETVQTQCPFIENTHKHFAMVTLETREGNFIPVRNFTYKEIFRPLKPTLVFR